MYFIDVQGTLISDENKSLIKGASELLKLLNARNIPYVIITNNTKDLNFLQNLRKKGLEIKENAYIDPFCVLENMLRPCAVAAFGSDEFLFSLENLGFKLDFNNPKALLVASWDDFKFKDFAKMIELAQKDTKIIAMHETSIYKKNGLAYPGVGAIMKMLEYATNAKYEVVGKPSVAFYEVALDLIKKQALKAEFKDICIISDDYKGDLIKAKALKMKTALVLSGKIKDAKMCEREFLDKIYPSVYEIFKELE